MTIAKALGFASLVALTVGSAPARETRVAVANDFAKPAKEIAALFERETGHRAVLSFELPGLQFAEILFGAPYQVFLSADQNRPKSLVDGGYAIAKTRFTYAIGTLVLWSKVVDVTRGEAVLKAGNFGSLAISNRKLGPYGLATTETLDALGLYDAMHNKFSLQKNATEVFRVVDENKADIGFVAASSLYEVSAGTRWIVPQRLYAPIRQDAVLLKKGENDEASWAFLEFLKGPQARAIIARYGYKVD